MTTLTEMVEAEAARAESEEPTEEPEPEGEEEPTEEPEPEGEEEPTEEPEAVVSIGPDEIRKAERARDAYRKKIAALFGEEAVAHECLLCAGLAYLPELPPLGTSFTLVAGAEGVELDFQEPRAEPPYKQAPDKETCPLCDGYGLTLTGAKTDGGRLWQCGRCGGSGWVNRGEAQPAAPSVARGYGPEPVTGQDGSAQLGPDRWGRPAGHKHWGVEPALIPG